MMDKLVKFTDSAYYGVMSMSLLICSVVGGAMAMFALENNHVWMLSLGLAFTMSNLVSCISQAPAKWIVVTFFASNLVNILIILLNLH